MDCWGNTNDNEELLWRNVANAQWGNVPHRGVPGRDEGGGQCDKGYADPCIFVGHNNAFGA